MTETLKQYKRRMKNEEAYQAVWELILHYRYNVSVIFPRDYEKPARGTEGRPQLITVTDFVIAAENIIKKLYRKGHLNIAKDHQTQGRMFIRLGLFPLHKFFTVN